MSQPADFNEVKVAAKEAMQKLSELFKQHLPVVRGNVYQKFTTKSGGRGNRVVQAPMPGFTHGLLGQLEDIFVAEPEIKKFILLGGNIHSLYDNISSLLVDDSIRQATLKVNYDPFVPLAESIARFAEEMANRIVRNEMRYTVLCSVRGLGNEPTRGKSFDLGEGVSLRIPQQDELLWHASRFLWAQYEFDGKFQDAAVQNSHGILEISVQRDISKKNVSRLYYDAEYVKKTAFDLLDICKWSLQSAFTVDDLEKPLGEATHVFFDPLDWLGLHGLQRFYRQQFTGSCISPTINKIDMPKAISLFGAATKACRESEDLRAAMYFYGRSCVADLPRDSLVEAVIGMERLLVTRGAISHKFRSYGAAVLADSSASVVAISQQLKKLYRERSESVHGSDTEEQELADEALFLLGRLMSRLLTMIGEGKIDQKEKIAKQLEALILKQSLLCPQSSPIEVES